MMSKESAEGGVRWISSRTGGLRFDSCYASWSVRDGCAALLERQFHEQRACQGLHVDKLLGVGEWRVRQAFILHSTTPIRLLPPVACKTLTPQATNSPGVGGLQLILAARLLRLGAPVHVSVVLASPPKGC